MPFLLAPQMAARNRSPFIGSKLILLQCSRSPLLLHENLPNPNSAEAACSGFECFPRQNIIGLGRECGAQHCVEFIVKGVLLLHRCVTLSSIDITRCFSNGLPSISSLTFGPISNQLYSEYLSVPNFSAISLSCSKEKQFYKPRIEHEHSMTLHGQKRAWLIYTTVHEETPRLRHY